MPDSKDKHWLLRRSTIRLLWILFSALLTLLVLADFLIHPHGLFGIDGTFGFYSWYGLLTCVAMVLLAKALGVLLKKPDSYYDE